ncbi:MAG TPA: hypothetical protein VLZ28_01855, partial [Daejeonella sp.]|nr:hypothetical protein [Daejeonella sp.]
MEDYKSLSIADPGESSPFQKLGSTLAALGLLSFLVAAFGMGKQFPITFFWLITGLLAVGGIFYSLPYFKALPGIKNNGIMQKGITNRG